MITKEDFNELIERKGMNCPQGDYFDCADVSGGLSYWLIKHHPKILFKRLWGEWKDSKGTGHSFLSINHGTEREFYYDTEGLIDKRDGLVNIRQQYNPCDSRTGEILTDKQMQNYHKGSYEIMKKVVKVGGWAAYLNIDIIEFDAELHEI